MCYHVVLVLLLGLPLWLPLWLWLRGRCRYWCLCIRH